MDVLKEYDIEDVLSIRRIRKGAVNRSYEIKTDKGEFILQRITEWGKWKKEKMRLEIKVLNYLKKGFEYEIPVPIKNKEGKYITIFKGEPYWVYTKVNGKMIMNYKLNEFSQEAEALAKYHSFIKNWKLKPSSDFMDFDFKLKKLEELKQIKPKNKLDKIVLKNVQKFIKLVKKLKSLQFDDFLITHSDFNNENLLFKKNRLTGIIDFHNLDYAPAALDIAIAIKRTNYMKREFNYRKMNIFLRYYEKHRKLSRKTKKLIVPLVLLNNAITFWWFYDGYEATMQKKLEAITKLINETNKLIRKI